LKRLETPATPRSRLCGGGQDLNLLGFTLARMDTSTVVQAASGVIGCIIFLFSLYGGLALGLEDALHRTVLPFGRRGEALQAIEGDLSEQVGPIEKEAGVRKQL